MDSSTTTLSSQHLPERGRRPKREGQSEELGKKPKKVNSEIRKQQNRIASRNYREKRKRKLQYLQQLVKGGPSDEQESEPSPDPHDAYARSLSAEYDRVDPISSPYILPSTSNLGSMSSSTTASHGVLAATSATFNSSHLLATTHTHTYPAFPQNWHAPIYSPPPPPPPPPPAPADVTWTVPSPWMSGSEYFVQRAPRPEMYHYTSPPAQPVFEQSRIPLSEPREFLSASDLSGFDSSYAPYSQAPGNSNYPSGQEPFAFERSVYI